MSEVERTEYLKNPTGLNALIVPLKSEIRLAKATSIKINDGNEHSEVQAGMEKYGDKETLITALKNNTSIDLSYSKEDKKIEETTLKTTQGLSISEQKQALESLKNELLEEQETVQSNQTDEGPTLSKRRK